MHYATQFRDGSEGTYLKWIVMLQKKLENGIVLKQIAQRLQSIDEAPNQSIHSVGKKTTQATQATQE
jgi:hypothetical protein